MPRNAHTCLQIDLSALEHNYALLRSQLPRHTHFMGVVKANGYGSDSVAVARKLETLGAEYLAVAFTREGTFLREHGIRLPIMVLHPQPSDLELLIKHCLEPNLYSRRILEGFAKAVRRSALDGYPVHLEFNTGLNRLGFRGEDLKWLPQWIQAEKALQLRSVFSHLSASDDLSQADFTRAQIEAFRHIAQRADALFTERPFKHLLNTSGVFHYPEAAWDMVRCGIGLYGYANRPGLDRQLRPVARLLTHISQIHEVRAGEWVGYNMGYRAESDRRIATLPLGHADGVGRHYGHGKGAFTIGGKQAPITGNVCMDMTMVDVSGLDCREGDPAIFFGHGVSAEVQAHAAGTISYELLTGISARVQREILDGRGK